MDNMYGYVYEIRNLVNGKVYIGKRARFTDVKSYMGSGIALKQAQKKYGIENFTKRILCEYESKEELCEGEKYFIAVYRHFYGPDMMYNIADGGEGRCGPISEEHKAKLIAANKGKHRSEEHKAKISAANKGRHHTEEVKAKISAVHRGKRTSDETKKKMSAAKKGKHISEETRQKMSDARKEYYRRKKEGLLKPLYDYSQPQLCFRCGK